MLASDLIEATKAGRVPTSILAGRRPDELAAGYWEALQQLASTDPDAAGRLAKLAGSIVQRAEDRCLALRALGLALRLRHQWAASANAFLAAAREAADPQAGAVVAIGAIDSLARARKFEEARRLGRRLVRELAALGETVQAGRAALNLGNACAWDEQDRKAAGWYVKAVELLTGSAAQTELASAQLGLSASFLMRSPSESAAWAEQARRRFLALGQPFYERLAGINLAQSQVIQGRYDDGRRSLLAIRAELGEAPTSDVARVEQFLGDAYVGLGLAREAIDAYERALGYREIRSLPFNDLLCWLGLARAHRLLGAQTQARQALRRAHRMAAMRGNERWVAAVEAMIADAAPTPRLAHRWAARALNHGDVLRGTLYEATASFAMARSREPEAIERAVRSSSRLPSGDFRWRAEWLLAQSEPRSRLRRYRRMFRAMLEDRAIRNTLESRAAFFADKQAALGEYLGFLLARPTVARVREVLSVLAQTRSATLLDELLASQTIVLSEAQLLELDDLRARLASDGDTGTRLAHTASSNAQSRRVRRRWSEALSPILSLPSASLKHPEGTVFLGAGDAMYRIENDRVGSSPFRRAELERDLRWLAFDLGTRPPDGGDGAATLEEFRRLAERLGWPTETIYPDLELWRFPWGLISTWTGREPTIGLHPAFSGGKVRLNKDATALVIAGDSGQLPQIEAEVDAVLAAFPRAQVVRTVSELRLHRERHYDLVHIAAHAGHNEDNPMFSTMYLEDGPMFATEFASMRIRSELTFLDACETARLSTDSPQEPDGWVRAALANGCRACLANLWPVDDMAAGRFSTNFYEGLCQSAELKDCVLSARRSVRSQMPHPFYWGTFVLFGGYAR